jgi:hypothetical protein
LVNILASFTYSCELNPATGQLFFTTNKTLALIWNIGYQMQYRMALDSKKGRVEEEKEWENPANPASTSDERDKEQLLRQYKEAKRRKDNLTEEQTDKKNK